MTAPVVDQAKQSKELGPRAKAVVHRVGMPPGVLAEPLEQADDRVILLVNFVVGEERTVLGVEDKHQPQQDSEQARIDLVRVVLQHVAEQLAVPLVVGRLEAAKQLIESGQDLLSQLGRDEVLVLAAFREYCRKPLLFWKRKEASADSSICKAAKMGRPATSDICRTSNVACPDVSPWGA